MSPEQIKYTQSFDKKTIESFDHVWFLTLEATDWLLIKKLLELYTEQDLSIAYSPNGKPYIETGLVKPLHFSLSHSALKLVLAISRMPIGVDVEMIKARSKHFLIAKRYFSKAEQTEDLIDFYCSWTAREALLKALGGRLFDFLPKILVDVKDSSFSLGINTELSHVAHFYKIDNEHIVSICKPKNSNKEIFFYDLGTLDL